MKNNRVLKLFMIWSSFFFNSKPCDICKVSGISIINEASEETIEVFHDLDMHFEHICKLIREEKRELARDEIKKIFVVNDNDDSLDFLIIKFLFRYMPMSKKILKHYFIYKIIKLAFDENKDAINFLESNLDIIIRRKQMKRYLK